MQPFGRFLGNDVPYPHVHLCFDDHSVSNWHSARPILNAHRAKAAFYVDSFHRLTDEELEMLSDLRSDGHVIGCHGKDHRDALAYSKRFNVDKYIEDEVLPAIEEMAVAGFEPTHFAFPEFRFDDTLFAAVDPLFCFVRSGSLTTRMSGGRIVPSPSRLDRMETPPETRIRRGDLQGAIETLRRGVDEGVGTTVVFHDIRPVGARAHAGTHARAHLTPEELGSVLKAITDSGCAYETFSGSCEESADIPE